jgi:hypothetical protein
MSNPSNSPRFRFDGDSFIIDDVLTILRPIFGGVILILFRNINSDENVSMRNNRSLLFCFTVDHGRKSTKNTCTTVANFVNQFDKTEYNVKLIFFIVRLDLQDIFVPLK